MSRSGTGNGCRGEQAKALASDWDPYFELIE